MLKYTQNQNNKYVKIYNVIIDAKRYPVNDSNRTIDSFSYLTGQGGLFTQIATEANTTKTPAYIYFTFVKDVNKTMVNPNELYISRDNLIAEVLIPVVPVSFKFEKTLKCFFEKFYTNITIIKDYIKNGTKQQSRVKEFLNDCTEIEGTLYDFVFMPKSGLDKFFEQQLSETGQDLKYANSHCNEIIAKYRENFQLCKYAIEFIYSFLHHDYGKYSTYMKLLDNSETSNKDFDSIYRPTDIYDQTVDMINYIKNYYKSFYYTANEIYCNRYSEVFRGLDIYDKSIDETPYTIPFSPANSPKKYIKDVLKLVNSVLINYGKFDKNAIIKTREDTEGSCLKEKNPDYLAYLIEKSNEEMAKLFKENPTETNISITNDDKSHNFGWDDDNSIWPKIKPKNENNNGNGSPSK